jgi:uncharacterized protein YdeI (BOF family)
MKPRTLIAGLTAVLLLAGGAAQSKSPFTAPNHSWITVSGTVKAATGSTFSIDYAGRSLLVEMDDWDWYAEARPIQKGQKVVVTGRIDDDLFQRRTIEASSVYVESLDTYFYASSADEENRFYPYGQVYDYRSGNFVALTGRVDSVGRKEFVLDTGAGNVVIDTAKMRDNPLDREGPRQVGKGDRVSVTGRIDEGLFERREVNATTVVVLRGE